MAFTDDAERLIELRLSQEDGVDKPELLRELAELLTPADPTPRDAPAPSEFRVPKPRESRLEGAALQDLAQAAAASETLVAEHEALAARPDGAAQIAAKISLLHESAAAEAARFMAKYEVFAEVEELEPA